MSQKNDREPKAAFKKPSKLARMSSGFRPIPKTRTTAMLDAEIRAVEMLGPFPVPDKARSISIRETYLPKKTIPEEIRTLKQAEDAVRSLVTRFRAAALYEQEAPRKGALVRELSEIRDLAQNLAGRLTALDRPTRQYLTNPGRPTSEFKDRPHLSEMLRRDSQVSWHDSEDDDFQRLSIRQLFPTPRDPSMPVAFHPGGLLVHILKETSGYLDKLVEEANYDLTFGHTRKLDGGGKGNIARHRTTTPEWELVVGAWKLFELCPNTSPSPVAAKNADAKLGATKRFTGLYDFLLNVYEAATGIPAGERDVLVHEHRSVQKLLTEARVIQRRLNDHFLRGTGYDAGDLWAASVGKSHWLDPQPGPKGAHPRRVPAAIREECGRLFRELGQIEKQLHWGPRKRGTRKSTAA